MRLNIYILLGHFIILYNQHDFAQGKALIGGTNIRTAELGDYNYIVSLMQIVPGHPQSGGEHFCTGVLITRRDILTADHCLEEEVLNETQIVIGTIDLRNGSIFYPYWWQTHTQWTAANNLTLVYYSDLATIRLLNNVSQTIIPVRFSRLSNVELYNAQVETAGWGLTNEGTIPDIMRIARLQVIENAVCETRAERIIGIRVPMNIRVLCTFVIPDIFIEFGDSGGPLLFRNRLIAINVGTCPGGEGQQYFNLHLGTHYYREYLNDIKSRP